MTRSTKTAGLLRSVARHRRWAIVLVFPPTDDVGKLHHVLRRWLTRAEAEAQLVDVELEDVVTRAVLDDGAWVTVLPLDRHGFVLDG